MPRILKYLKRTREYMLASLCDELSKILKYLKRTREYMLVSLCDELVILRYRCWEL